MPTLDGVDGTFYEVRQNPQSFSIGINITANTTILTNGQSIGLTAFFHIPSKRTKPVLSHVQLIVEASFLSLGAIIAIFISIARNVLRYKKTFPNGNWKLLRTPADIYMLSLFVYDILLSFGGILNIRWAHDGIVTTGTYCTAQGIFKQLGAVGVALITLVLTTHTFMTALWRVGANARNFAFGIVSFICLFVVLWVSIGNGIHKDYETPTPYWCWIGSKYDGERLFGEYLWMWVSLCATVVMYVPVHFWMKGYLSVDDEKWYKFRLKKSEVESSQRRATLGILFYPLAYSLTVIPLSVSRWLRFNNVNVPSAAILFGGMMFNLSGAINVLLFLIVRPHLLLFTPPEELGEPEVELTNSSNGFARLSDTVKYEQRSQPTGTRVMDDV